MCTVLPSVILTLLHQRVPFPSLSFTAATAPQQVDLSSLLLLLSSPTRPINQTLFHHPLLTLALKKPINLSLPIQIVTPSQTFSSELFRTRPQIVVMHRKWDGFIIKFAFLTMLIPFYDDTERDERIGRPQRYIS